jgi:flagellar capping protein FliD
VNATISSLNGTVKRLDNLGIQSNGNNDSLELADSAQLDAALTSNLNDVKQLFSDSSNGLMVKLSDYLDRTVGDSGSIITRQTDLTRQSSDIDQQISDMERIIQNNQQTMIDSFVAMEQTQAQINQQLQFLNQRFGTG